MRLGFVWRSVGAAYTTTFRRAKRAHTLRLLSYVTSVGPLLGPYWTTTRLLLDLYWSSSGLLLDLYWISTGPLIYFHWTSTGALLGR